LPHIWGVELVRLGQYNKSIEQPMIRNGGEAVGVGAKVNWTGRGRTLFTSTVPVDNLCRIESGLAGPKQPQGDNRFTVRGNWNGGHLFDTATPRNQG
jgi:hypothetical protein